LDSGFCVLVGVMILLLTGCSGEGPPVQTPVVLPLLATPETSPTPDSPFPVTVEDGAGNRVTISAEPERIVSLAPSHTEILFALGLGDRVMGVTHSCNYPPEAADKPKIATLTTVDLSELVSLGPDLVLGAPDHMAEVAPALQEQGITVYLARPETLFEVMKTILTVGHITGQDQAAELLVINMENRLGAVQDRIEGQPRPRVFWEMDPTGYTVGPGTLVHDLMAAAGGDNIAAEAGVPWLQLNQEAILLNDPDVIVLADLSKGQTAEIVSRRPGWDAIRAIRYDRIVEITDIDVFSRPGPRIVLGVELLAQAFYPDLFR